MKGNRSPSRFLVEQFKAAGYDHVIPSACVRFIRVLLPQLPNDWQNLDRDSLIKKVRFHCEISAATGDLKRRRSKGSQGYIYEIVT